MAEDMTMTDFLTDTGELLARLETCMNDKNDEYQLWRIDMTC